MIKGAQKRMIVVKTGDSAVFEEVYFVMRRESSAERLDMLAEANRIIESCGGNRKRGKSKKLRAIFWSLGIFLCGGAVGGFISAIAGFAF